LGVKLKISPSHPSPGAVLAEKSVGSRARPQSSYKFEDLAVTRLVSDGKPTSGFTSYYRLNRALPFAPGGSSKEKKKAARVCSQRIYRWMAFMRKVVLRLWATKATTRAGTVTQKPSKSTHTNISPVSAKW
jgi:hypothetical protein